MIGNHTDLLDKVMDLADGFDVLAIGLAFHAIAEASMDHDREKLIAPPMTAAEHRRRFAMLVEQFRILRGDLNYTMNRTVAHLPMTLRCELDGVDWESRLRSEGGYAPRALAEFGERVG